MLHPGPLIDADGVDVSVEAGASAAIDRAADGAQAFLRATWFAAGAKGAPLVTLSASRGGETLAAIPLVGRKLGPLRIREVAGSYWPYRSIPAAPEADAASLAALLADGRARAALGRAWRLGPIYADDTARERLIEAARLSGWTVLSRRLGTCYVVDLKRLTGEGTWPSSKTLRKNRWLERRLAEDGELEFRACRGSDWNDEVFDLLAAIESESWVGQQSDRRDTKFLDADNRRMWAQMLSDPEIASRLSCAILSVGGVPAAFTFMLDGGSVRHFIANSYSERFADRSPGRILLYRNLQEAAEEGIETFGWGAGDAGYKTEMGAEPGPEILDHLIVRGPLVAALARPLWLRRN